MVSWPFSLGVDVSALNSETGGMGLFGKKKPEPQRDRAGGRQYGLRTNPEELRGVRIRGTKQTTKADDGAEAVDTLNGDVTSGRMGRRDQPVFQRPQTHSEFRVGGVEHEMVFGLVGATHALFVARLGDAPKLGQTIELNVPTDPIAAGKIWMTGKVTQLRTNNVTRRARIEVEWPEFSSLPSVYRRLIDFCVKTMKGAK